MIPTRSRSRFRIEAGAAVLSGLLAVLTAFVPDWVEAAFGVDPDAGSGSLEWAVVALAGLVAVVLAPSRAGSGGGSSLPPDTGDDAGLPAGLARGGPRVTADSAEWRPRGGRVPGARMTGIRQGSGQGSSKDW